MNAALLELDGVGRHYGGGAWSRRRVDALHDVSLRLDGDAPRILAVVGESGSGKTTLARLVLGQERADHGTVRFEGADLAARRGRAARLAFMRKVQPVFQNPFEAFNPLRPVDRYLHATAACLAGADRADVRARVDTALGQVGLALDEIEGRFPHELSGGQLQRVAIARALIPSPALLVADEPVSMVDASLRMAIVELFRELRDGRGVSMVYITHDLATAFHVSDAVAILLGGHLVEGGRARDVLSVPLHPYTQLLRSSVLEPDSGGAPAAVGAPAAADAPVSSGEARTVAATGCRFSARCPHVFDRCRAAVPPLFPQADGRSVRCFLHDNGVAAAHEHAA